METLLPIFTVKALGWTNENYAQYYSTASLIGGISGMIIGGILVDKFGKKKMMNIYFFSSIFSTTVLAFQKHTGAIGVLFMRLWWYTTCYILSLASAFLPLPCNAAGKKFRQANLPCI